MKGRSIEELGVDSRKLMAYIKSLLKIQKETGIQKKYSIAAGHKSVLLTYFVQDHSQESPVYSPSRASPPQ